MNNTIKSLKEYVTQIGVTPEEWQIAEVILKHYYDSAGRCRIEPDLVHLHFADHLLEAAGSGRLAYDVALSMWVEERRKGANSLLFFEDLRFKNLVATIWVKQLHECFDKE